MENPNRRELQERVERIEKLIQAIDVMPDETARAQSRELVEALLEMQGAGLERLMELIYDSGPEGQAMIDRLGADELVSSLLLVHGLHPLDLESRVRNALEKVGPRLAQHGGSVEFLGVSREGALKLRLAGNCHGCPSSILTLKFSIEEAITRLRRTSLRWKWKARRRWRRQVRIAAMALRPRRQNILNVRCRKAASR